MFSALNVFDLPYGSPWSLISIGAVTVGLVGLYFLVRPVPKHKRTAQPETGAPTPAAQPIAHAASVVATQVEQER